jgi:polyisoprenoid-binding protein YceI
VNPRRRARIAALAVLLLAPVVAPAHAATAWAMDPAQSSLTFHPTLAGGEFAGRFEQFEATIRFDPADLAHSSLLVVVDLLAARTGDPDRDTALQGQDFFLTSRWPQARFASTAIKALGGNKYEATGKLTLRDATRDIRLALHFDPPAAAGGVAKLTGSTTVKRLEFGVGQGDWRGTEWLADAVRVEFSLALRAPR